VAKGKGKYAEVLGELPKTFGNDPKYQDTVNATKAKLIEQIGESRTKERMTAKYAALRAKKDALEDAVKDVNLYIEAYSQLLAETFEAEGTLSLTIEEGTLRVQHEPYPTVKDPDAVRAWALKNGLERKMSLPWKTLEGLVKQRLLDGMEDIPGVKVFNKIKFVFTKS